MLENPHMQRWQDGVAEELYLDMDFVTAVLQRAFVDQGRAAAAF